MNQKSGIFDMIGPIMIGPSSSHTAGVVKIANVAYKILGGQPDEAVITFYNSFARTYEGHGSDKAVLGGLLGFATDDERIRNSPQIAQEQGMKYTYKAVGNASTLHPNTIKLELTKNNKRIEIIGESRGGGLINIASYNGFRADFTAQLPTLIIEALDIKGSIAFIAQVLAQDDCNIATMNVSRKAKHDIACHFIEMDTALENITIQYLLHLKWIHNIIYLTPIT
ncbi:MAG: L-serine ammonia-lyase, iron-sulfur-dependent subunit beta [Microscillaceae bacterium]|nr:L-serine ammonia-lyase, iron-sulfur-dependent subunit beta [Microscillaceae bacterium]MDW8461922.1 L-serine ammonia-lyase, iron-sulfur-dependent subunit beta [Cytophagales bacterium]